MASIFSNYNFTQNGVVYPFDNVFVPADTFRRGNLWSWGTNSSGELGVNDTTSPRITPITTTSGTSVWKEVASGYNRSAGIKIDGTLWLWGNNQYGQLGNNNQTNTLTPITTFVGGTNWKQVSIGRWITAAVKTDGTLWIWGQNRSGSLGINVGSTVNRLTPVTTFVGGTNWKQVSCGYNRVSAVKTDGSLWTWGASGTLGNGSVTDSLIPITIGGTNWKQTSSGAFSMGAVKTDGTLWMWGSGSYGVLGNSSGSNRPTPVTTFLGGENWKQISTKSYSTSAVKTDGTLWSWGRNQYGQLGINNTTDTDIPTQEFNSATDWKQVSCGGESTSAVKTDGSLWVWGRNISGSLGINIGTFVTRRTPVTTFLGGNKWKQVDAGSGTHMAAIEYVDYLI